MDSDKKKKDEQRNAYEAQVRAADGAVRSRAEGRRPTEGEVYGACFELVRDVLRTPEIAIRRGKPHEVVVGLCMDAHDLLMARDRECVELVRMAMEGIDGGKLDGYFAHPARVRELCAVYLSYAEE